MVILVLETQIDFSCFFIFHFLIASFLWLVNQIVSTLINTLFLCNTGGSFWANRSLSILAIVVSCIWK
jgi:hypothetical protein